MAIPGAAGHTAKGFDKRRAQGEGVRLDRLVFGLALVLFMGPAKAEMLLTPDGFTRQVAAAINAHQPNAPVSITSLLTLEGRTDNGKSVQMNLERIYGLCRADQARCPETVAAYVGQAGALLRPVATEPTQAGLRLAVRPDAYVRGLVRTTRDAVPTSSRSLPPGLLAVIYLDSPTSMQLQTLQQLQGLHVSEDQAFATALQNTARVLQPLDQVAKPVRPGEVGGFRGTAYESSRLLFVSAWGQLASQFGGHLLVAVPSSNEVIYANGAGADALSRISALARARFAKADRPTSAAVFEWHPDGWTVAPPPASRQPN